MSIFEIEKFLGKHILGPRSDEKVGWDGSWALNYYYSFRWISQRKTWSQTISWLMPSWQCEYWVFWHLTQEKVYQYSSQLGCEIHSPAIRKILRAVWSTRWHPPWLVERMTHKESSGEKGLHGNSDNVSIWKEEVQKAREMQIPIFFQSFHFFPLLGHTALPRRVGHEGDRVMIWQGWQGWQGWWGGSEEKGK